MMKTKTLAIAAVAVAILGVASAPASAAIMVGDTLDIQYTFPDLGTVYSDSGNFTYTGPGQSFTSAGITTLFLSGNSVVFANDQNHNGQSFFGSSFNGPILYDITNGTAFTGWNVLSATAPYTSAYLTAGGVGVNFSGQLYVQGTSVTIGVNAVPEPATWAMMLVGFSGLGVAVRMRRRQSVTATA